MVSWILRRMSGLVLGGYLIAHILVTGYLTKGEKNFDEIMELLHNPFAKLLEIGLLGVVIYHALNGIKVIMLNWGVPSKHHKLLFWSTAILGIIIFAAGAIPLLISAWNIYQH